MKQFFLILIPLLLLSSSFPIKLLTARAAESNHDQCKAWLVQSIPTDMPHLKSVPGVLATADVFRWLAGNSSRKLDIMAQYWQLIAHPNDSHSGDYGYSNEDMQRFGSGDGSSVYKSIEDAADRDVNIRLLQHSGVYPDFTEEPDELASGRENVQSVTLLSGDWFGTGVVHAKVWISDSRDVYIGSANNDWKSLTQVKEVGIYLVDCPSIVRKVEINRTVPCWSHLIPPKGRCRSPLPKYVEVPHTAGYPPLTDPSTFQTSIQTPGCNYSFLQPLLSYLSFAPPELSFGKYQTDEQAWVDTIKSVKVGETVRISTMDWLGQSEYAEQTVYWSSLSSAISEVIFSKNATVKILVAYWAHFITNTDQYLKSLLYSNNLCTSSSYNTCSGKIEIKYYLVPGFNLTGPAISHGKSTGNKYPGYSRVNHGKYAVSDKRAHIGTSNLIWDYFYTTIGISFGTYNPAIVSQLQKVFDADWDSPYAVPVQPLQDGHTTFSS